MLISIRDIRNHLQITLDDLARYLGISLSRLQQLETGIGTETGEVDDRLYRLVSQLEAAQKDSEKDAPLADAAANQTAEQWLTAIRDKALTDITLLETKLSDMKTEYDTYINAIHLISHIIDDPSTTPEIRALLIYRRPILINKSKKHAPMVQAKLIVQINEARGRSKMWPEIERKK
jgi:transcriptional regulator with XRE-family HTH domain